MPQFLDHNNRWRVIAFPAVYALMAALFSTRAQFLDINYMSGSAFVAVLLTAFAIETWFPSQVNYTRPHYSMRGRIGFGALHAFAWTALGLAAFKLVLLIVLLARNSN
jgi:hypothetical protein